MSDLITFSQIAKELTVDANGVGYCSISGASRIVGLSGNSALVRHFGTDLEVSKLAEILTSKGFKPADLAQTGIPDTALTLIIEYYAFDAGRYCTEQARNIYRTFAAIGLRTTIQKAVGYKVEPVSTQQTEMEQNINGIALALNMVLKRHCKPDIIDLTIANNVSKAFPALTPAMEEAKKLIGSENAQEENFISPTELGKLMETTGLGKLSGMRVNQLLIEKGYQTKNEETKEPTYLVTEKGETFGKILINAIPGNNKSTQNLRWKPSVIKALLEDMAS